MNAYKFPQFKVKLVKDRRGQTSERAADTKMMVRAFMAAIDDAPHEEVWIGMLDTMSRCTGLVKVSQGGIHGAALLAADILRPAVVGNARGIILCHNHPSGDPTPSREDRTLTESLQRACSVINVPLLDHLVVTSDASKFTSFFERGIL